MQKGGDSAPLKPAVAWTIIAVVVVAVLAVGFKMFAGGSGKYDTSGSEALMDKVKSGGKLYEPPMAGLPPDVRARLGGGMMPGGAPMTGPGTMGPGAMAPGTAPMGAPGSVPPGPGAGK